MKAQCEEYTMPCSEIAYNFITAKSFASAARVVLGGIIEQKAYQHYCSLGRILEKITQGRWFLSRCSSLSMNDLQEPLKFAGGTDVLKRTYIACFEHCLSEDVAMWGLYGKSNPFALRVTIPGKVLVGWMRCIEINSDSGSDAAQKAKRGMSVKELDAKDAKHKAIPEGKIDSSVFRDVLYASVSGNKKRDEYDIRRGNRVSWEKSYYNLQDGECVTDGFCAGFIKDCEWSHEMESRLCVRLNEEIDSDCISIAIPPEVIAQMRFTFSPWLQRSLEKYVRNALEDALREAGVNMSKKPRFQRFRRSVLQGGLNFK